MTFAPTADNNPSTIAFCAHITEHLAYLPSSEGSIVPFCSVLTNISGAYNPVTNTFTALVASQHFIEHADYSPSYRSFVVNLNGQSVFGADSDGAQNHHVTGSALLTLPVSDVITTSVLDAGKDSTFTGLLLQPCPRTSYVTARGPTC